MTDWNRERLEDLRSRSVYGRSASYLGTITEVLFEPEQASSWVAVDIGHALVILPLDDASVTRRAVYLPLYPAQLQALVGHVRKRDRRSNGRASSPTVR